MTTIITQTAKNAYQIQDAFRAAKRDEYPLGVYEAIFDLINDTHGEPYYHLDVVAWCGDIMEMEFDPDDLYTFDDLVSDLERKTTVLYVDEDAKVVYYLAY